MYLCKIIIYIWLIVSFIFFFFSVEQQYIHYLRSLSLLLLKSILLQNMKCNGNATSSRSSFQTLPYSRKVPNIVLKEILRTKRIIYIFTPLILYLGDCVSSTCYSAVFELTSHIHKDRRTPLIYLNRRKRNSNNNFSSTHPKFCVSVASVLLPRCDSSYSLCLNRKFSTLYT